MLFLHISFHLFCSVETHVQCRWTNSNETHGFQGIFFYVWHIQIKYHVESNSYPRQRQNCACKHWVEPSNKTLNLICQSLLQHYHKGQDYDNPLEHLKSKLAVYSTICCYYTHVWLLFFWSQKYAIFILSSFQMFKCHLLSWTTKTLLKYNHTYKVTPLMYSGSEH